MLVSDEQRFALHYHFHLLQVVADKGGAGADNVEDGICQTDGRSNLHRTRDNMDVGLNVLLCQEVFQDIGVGGSNLFVIEPFQSVCEWPVTNGIC